MDELEKELLQHIPKPGKLVWIGIRPEKRGPVLALEQVEATSEKGLNGDHYRGSSGKRQLTLIQHEHLQTIGSFLTREPIDPHLTRRNLVVEGINLNALHDCRLKIGESLVLEITGLCPPCKQMEKALGYGGYHAMTGLGGLTARILEGGTLRLGDSVTPI